MYLNRMWITNCILQELKILNHFQNVSRVQLKKACLKYQNLEKIYKRLLLYRLLLSLLCIIHSACAYYTQCRLLLIFPSNWIFFWILKERLCYFEKIICFCNKIRMYYRIKNAVCRGFQLQISTWHWNIITKHSFLILNS